MGTKNLAKGKMRMILENNAAEGDGKLDGGGEQEHDDGARD